MQLKSTQILPSEVPNEKLRKGLAEAKKGIGVKTYKNKKELFESLKKL
jgi:hypothetical protein